MEQSVISGAVHVGNPGGLVEEIREKRAAAIGRIDAAGTRQRVRELEQKLEDADFEIAALKRKLRAACVPVLSESKPNWAAAPVKINNYEMGPISKGPVCLRLILDCVAAYYGKTPQDLRSDSRTWEDVEPRHVVIYFCRKLTKLSSASIGRGIGDRDHSTVVHAFAKMEIKRANNPEFAERLDRIAILIKQNVDVNAHYGCPHD